MILAAGGFTDFARENNVAILRKDASGENKELLVKVKDLMKGDISKNVEIYPGDLIVVKESLF